MAPLSRARIVAETRRWLGTPYRHQASVLAAGADCVGLVRGVFRALYGHEPGPLPGYAPDWPEGTGRETLLEAARHHLVEIPVAAMRPGDVLVFRWRTHLPATHAGLAADGLAAPPEAGAPAPLTLVHALEGAAVAEVPLSPWWRRRVAAAFAFPGVTD